jgi:hypothetical protein
MKSWPKFPRPSVAPAADRSRLNDPLAQSLSPSHDGRAATASPPPRNLMRIGIQLPSFSYGGDATGIGPTFG